MKVHSDISAGKRVAILWGIILAVFALFNALFWPLRHWQEKIDPANFAAYAKQLHAEGRAEEAVRVLRQGIDTLHPPCAEPYALLVQWAAEGKISRDVKLEKARAAFYQALAAKPEQRMALLKESIAQIRPPQPYVLEPNAPLYLKQAAVTFATAFELKDKAKEWPTEEQVAFLRLPGGAISLNGQIGATGVRCPQSVLAVSCGGPGPGKRAQLWLRGRDLTEPGRGFHAVLLEPKTGQVVNFGLFDVWDRAEEAERMAAFLQTAPKGCIGVFAVADDASVYMDARLEEELCSFGLSAEASVQRAPALFGLRYSFAAIGVKGAKPGAALQAWSPPAFGKCAGHPVACGVFYERGAAS